MGNPNPSQSDQFKKCQYKAQGDISLEPLDKKNTQVKLPVNVSKAIKELPESAAWLRKVIIKAAQEKGLI